MVIFAPELSAPDRRAYLAVPDITRTTERVLVWMRRGLLVVAMAVAVFSLVVILTSTTADLGSTVDEARSSGTAAGRGGDDYVVPVLRLLVTVAVLVLLFRSRRHIPALAGGIGSLYSLWRRRGWRGEVLETAGLPPRLDAALRRLDGLVAGLDPAVADRVMWDSARRAVASDGLQRAVRDDPDNPARVHALTTARALADWVVDDADELADAIERRDTQWRFRPAESSVITLSPELSLRARADQARELLP